MLQLSHCRYRADKCYAILEEMRREVAFGQNLYTQPTHDTYHAIIRTCATCTGSEEERDAAFQVLTRTMREYLKYAESTARIDAFLFSTVPLRSVSAATGRRNKRRRRYCILYR